MMSYPPCPVCQSSRVAMYLDDREEGLDAAALGSSRKSISHGRILRCGDCQFGFRQTRSNDRELAELYRQMDTGVYEAEAGRRAKTAARHLQIVHAYARVGRLLDVGCASGLFLQGAYDAGWQVVGVEPSDTLFAKAKAALNGRAELHCDILQNTGLARESFDAVTLWDVLEHVPDPLAFIQHCAALLKPGGRLFLNVPDLDSVEARVLKDRWPLLLAEHLNYFNRPSLKLCGEKAGLTWLKFGRRRVSFSVEYVLYRLSQHRIPGASIGHQLTRGNFLGAISIPVSLGETYGVWKR